jgi:hypothetical protein
MSETSVAQMSRSDLKSWLIGKTITQIDATRHTMVIVVEAGPPDDREQITLRIVRLDNDDGLSVDMVREELITERVSVVRRLE